MEAKEEQLNEELQRRDEIGWKIRDYKQKIASLEKQKAKCKIKISKLRFEINQREEDK